MKNLDQESFFFDFPGKVPEAYQKALSEFERRKAFEIAVSQVIAQIQKVVTQETIQREEFNGKYGAFLPDSISHDLVKQPI